MPFFACRFKTPTGRTRKELLFAADSEAARRRILGRGEFPMAIDPSGRVPGRKRLSLSQTKDWAEILAMLLHGGHTVAEAMKLMRSFGGKGSIRKTAVLIEKELDKGCSFRGALEAVPVRFPPGFVPFAGIGETVGSLDAVMNHVAEYYGRLVRLRDRIGSAMIYPSLVLLVALAAGIFLGLVTLPSLREMMIELGNCEGGPAVSDGGAGPFPGFFATAAASVLALLAAVIVTCGNRGEGHAASRLLLKLPFLGGVLRNWDLMRWSFSLELLAGQGVPMDRALEESAGTVGNRYLRSRMGNLSTRLSKGEDLSGLLSREKDIPEIVPGWLAIGEETGNVAGVFKTLRDYFERQVVNAIEWATQLIEPTLILVIGLLMLVMVGKYVLPVFRLMGNLL